MVYSSELFSFYQYFLLVMRKFKVIVSKANINSKFFEKNQLNAGASK